MLEDHVELSIRRCLELLANHKDPADFIDAFRNMSRSRQDPLGRSPLLHMEMILFVARAEQRRPELAKRLRARRQMVTEIVETTAKHSGRNFSDPAWVGAILLALEDGFRLHRLGYAHSFETWRDGALVGGLYGMAIGRMFYGESMFSRATDASMART